MAKKWRVIIVEDEYLARENLKNMLNICHHDIEIVGEAETAKEALLLFNQLNNIDGVFIDILLETESSRSGLDLASVLSKRENPPWLIFTTAYKKHALEAIKTHPADYLLKPLDASKLDAALNYVRRVYDKKIPVIIAQTDNETSIEIRHSFINQYGEKEKCKCFIKPSDIVYVRTNQVANTLRIKMVNGEILDNVVGTLTLWQDKLNKPYFFKIYKSHFVNLKEAQSVHPHPFQKETYQLAFKCCNERLTIGDTFYEQLLQRLQNGEC
jgi:two-component system, LytTR family, response regulator LytT